MYREGGCIGICLKIWSISGVLMRNMRRRSSTRSSINRALAKELGINGTPAFVVGKELLPGAIELDALKEVVARARGVK